MATIPGVSNNELIRQTWGQAVANELNNLTVKVNGDIGDGRPGLNQWMTGPLTIRANPALHLQHASNTPIVYWEHTSGTPHYGYVQGGTFGLRVTAEVGTLLLRVGSVDVVELQSGLLKVANGSGRFGLNAATGSAVQVYGTSGSGVTGNAHVGFYPSATNVDTLGTRGGFVGFVGAGLELQADIGNLLVSSLVGAATLQGDTTATVTAGTDVTLAAADDINFSPGGVFKGMFASTGQILVGKAAVDIANTGVELWGAQGEIQGTVDTNIPNLLMNRTGTGDVDGGQFARFDINGVEKGKIEWDTATSKVLYSQTSDYRLKNDLGPIVDGVERIKALRPRRITRTDSTNPVEHDAFIAHEVQPYVPAAVSGVKDAVAGPPPEGEPPELYPAEGTPIYQTLDYSALVTVTIAALQDLVAQVETLTARIDALEAAA